MAIRDLSLCCYSSPPSRDGGSWLNAIRLRVAYAWRSDRMHVAAWELRITSGSPLCRGLTRATYILCIEHLRMLRLRWESNPGPPALQANTLCKEPFERRISCHSGSRLVLLQYLVTICNLTHLQDENTKVKFMLLLRILEKNHVGSETGSGSETNWKVGSGYGYGSEQNYYSGLTTLANGIWIVPVTFWVQEDRIHILQFVSAPDL